MYVYIYIYIFVYFWPLAIFAKCCVVTLSLTGLRSGLTVYTFMNTKSRGEKSNRKSVDFIMKTTPSSPPKTWNKTHEHHRTGKGLRFSQFQDLSVKNHS